MNFVRIGVVIHLNCSEQIAYDMHLMIGLGANDFFCKVPFQFLGSFPLMLKNLYMYFHRLAMIIGGFIC